MALFERWRKLGLELEKPDNGILLIVNGDFNDGDYIEQTWTFKYDDIGLVMWLLEHYEKFDKIDMGLWDEILEGKERKLYAPYVPRIKDTCIEIHAHTVYEAHAYIFENGMCREIKSAGSYEIPSTDSLYERYFNGDSDEDEDDDYDD